MSSSIVISPDGNIPQEDDDSHSNNIEENQNEIGLSPNKLGKNMKKKIKRFKELSLDNFDKATTECENLLPDAFAKLDMSIKNIDKAVETHGHENSRANTVHTDDASLDVDTGDKTNLIKKETVSQRIIHNHQNANDGSTIQLIEDVAGTSVNRKDSINKHINNILENESPETYLDDNDDDVSLDTGDKTDLIKKKRNRRRRKHIRGSRNANDAMAVRPTEAIPGTSVNLKDSKYSINNHNHDILALQDLYFLHNKMKNLTNVTKAAAEKNSHQTITVPNNPTPMSPKAAAKKKSEKKFETYISREEVQKGLESRILFEGSLRINPKANLQAYVSHPDKESDVLISGVRDRNRALEEDIVVVQLLPNTDPSSDKRLGKVVYITRKVHSRTCIGKLEINQKQKGQAVFYPRDKRTPILFIPFMDCPPLFQLEHKKYEKVLILAKITSWTNTRFAIGTIVEIIGHCEDMKVQTKAILLENRLDVTPYGDEVKHLYPDDTFVIPDIEYQTREDFRNTCVFTIDPLTARDLDDAMSCKDLPNGNYEIGVHISDVTYFLKEGNILDDMVAAKATTVYLVDGTYHMLPKELCFLCSLLPGNDKLSFSVIWEITKDGKIINHRFARTIINSCCQLAYEHAQTMLENPGKVFSPDDFPAIVGPYGLDQISQTVCKLFNLSAILRQQRYDNGSLRIDQPKMSFRLDPQTGLPVNYRLEDQNESHSLIEEFMLLANMTVATRIYEDFPSRAFLRHHPPPKNTLPYAVKQFKRVGIELDVGTSGSFQASVTKYTKDNEQGPVAVVLYTILIKTLARAEYFCSSGIPNEDTHHYSLSIPLYTHFTSPIRRYPDIIVHRLLCASLAYSPPPTWEAKYVKHAARICNQQKYNAKRAGDMSAELYALKYIALNSPLEMSAVVMDIMQKGVDVVITSMGLVRRVFYDNFADTPVEAKFIGYDDSEPQNQIQVKWAADSTPEMTEMLRVFSVITVVLKKTDDLLKINVRVKKPQPK